jgi:hypothetical protein
MKISDELTKYHQQLLGGDYDCLDRIVVNAYFAMGQVAGGFRNWWRDLFGSDDQLDRAHLERMAGRFRRRVQAYARKHRIPFLECATGERKHEIAKEYIPKDPDFIGVFLILVGRAPAPVWQVYRNQNGRICDIYRPKSWPHVNHYYFHLMDPEWGHVTIRMCGYPPFGAQVILNGHEWVERTARKQGVQVNKEGNCFVEGSDFQALDRIAMTLRQADAIGRLTKVCDRWVYSSCLCFGLDLQEQQQSRFQYQYSCFQLEYSRNLLFAGGHVLDEVYQKLIDRTRTKLDLKTLKTIFGFKRRPRQPKKRGQQAKRLERVIERPTYDLTVFKLRWGNLTLKIYDKGGQVLRVEVVAHNVGELRCGRMLEKLPELAAKMQQMLVHFLNVVQAAHISFLDVGLLESWSQPTQRGSRRLAGIDLNQERMRHVVNAVIALAAKPDGFALRDLSDQVQQRLQVGSNPKDSKFYTVRQASYDLAKLRGKQLVDRQPRTHRYKLEPASVCSLCGYLLFRDGVLKPIVAGVINLVPSLPPPIVSNLDQHYLNLREELFRTFETLGIAA